jgi:hypothetical protein
MKKLIASLLTFILFIQIVPRVSAKPKGDWDDVKALVSRPIAARTKNGVTHFGLLEEADDNTIRIWLAGKDALTQKIRLRRDEVAKVWFAKLHIDEANIGKGAWIGAGVGFGAALIAAASTAESGPLHGGGYFVMIGAGVGALLGTQWKKKHKKQGLVYSI